MHPQRAIQILALASVAQASWFNFNKAEPRDGLLKRQSGTASGAETTSTAAAQTTTSAAAVTTTTTAAPVTSTTVAIVTTTTLRTSTTSAGSNNDETTSASAASSTHSTTAEPVTSTIKTIITTTNSAGVATSFTSEATVTSTPGLNEANSGDSSSGMSSETRKTVIGVVVGVGGAIVLGALGFVAWRIWGKKKQAEENDGLMEYNNQYGNEPKNEIGSAQGSGSGRTPFQSTLESYHAPNQKR
ncbi:uncharacterized protein BDZ83DRAFT_160232 [Colletotrichum acutatum]|uniref:Mid2 domain-containing protein n=1 Tax=Glomerella acutata TaxID=27357 RepID=A0AAD8XQ01_GLOAC|nr:uncharacterized protein BDZ83DRAFT_160232 [Colletotrichum acutatum]KAK1731458.1 hypothetical protein BDZ83DRAFT_160232 [Colletotrichum acutatum]